MTKKKFTIADVFKYQKQAMLIAKMQGDKSAETFDTIIELLKNDLRLVASGGYGNNAPDPAHWKAWRLRTADFAKLTPYYKAFGISSMTEMRELLMQARRNTAELKKTDRKRYLRRKNKHNFPINPDVNDNNQVISCTNKNRVTPLSKLFYKHVIVGIIVKRLGLVGVHNSGLFMPYSTFVNCYSERHHKDYGAIIPVIGDKQIMLMFKGVNVDCGEQFTKALRDRGMFKSLSKFDKATRPRVGAY